MLLKFLIKTKLVFYGMFSCQQNTPCVFCVWGTVFHAGVALFCVLL